MTMEKQPVLVRKMDNGGGGGGLTAWLETDIGFVVVLRFVCQSNGR